MDISTYTAEDFVLDPAFRKWVLHPNAASNLMWEKLLAANPSKYTEANKAREIIIHVGTKNHQMLSNVELRDLWQGIERELSEKESIYKEDKVIPLNAASTLQKQIPKRGVITKNRFHYLFRVACILALAIGLGFMAGYFLPETVPEELTMVVYEERHTVPGVKAHLTLSDGSQVFLNSGSKLRYIKNFERDRREVFLEGEAFFEVARDSLRPFTVLTGKVKTTALGTSFNIRSYAPEALDISLLTGKVAVEVPMEETAHLTLEPGEAINVNIAGSHLAKSRFDEEMVIGWTKKLLVFQKTPLPEAIRTLENWYGVTFETQHEPGFQVLFSGRFHNETLENVLEGLGYAAKFDFTINNDKVTIKF